MTSNKSVYGFILLVNSFTPSEPRYGSTDGKTERFPFQNGRIRALQVEQLIHNNDVCGPMH
jgi:hypothetical protein